MFRRTLMILALSAFAFTASASAQTPPAADDFHFHKSVFHNREVIQTTSKLFLLPPANGWATAAQFRAAQVEAAIDWFVGHGYLVDSQPSVSLQTDANGNQTLVISGAGVHIAVILDAGPFFPQQRDQRLSAIIIRNLPPQINNGY